MKNKKKIMKVAILGLTGFLGLAPIKDSTIVQAQEIEKTTEEKEYQGIICVYLTQGEKISKLMMGKVFGREGKNIYQSITSPEIYLVENIDKGKFTYKLRGKGNLREEQEEFLNNVKIENIVYVIGDNSISYDDAYEAEQKYAKAYEEIANSNAVKELCYMNEEGETIHRVVIPTIIADEVAYTTVTEPKVNVIEMGLNNYWLQTKDNTSLTFVYMCTFMDVTKDELTEEYAIEIEENLNQTNKRGKN